jgi:hypothetical protein
MSWKFWHDDSCSYTEAKHLYFKACHGITKGEFDFLSDYSTHYGFERGLSLKEVARVAEDFTYSFKTVEQRWNPHCVLPYGPTLI